MPVRMAPTRRITKSMKKTWPKFMFLRKIAARITIPTTKFDPSFLLLLLLLATP
jgi:hypothetical protein